MRKETREEKPAPAEQASDGELLDVLIAISVVARQMARRIMRKGDDEAGK